MTPLAWFLLGFLAFPTLRWALRRLWWRAVGRPPKQSAGHNVLRRGLQ